MADGHRVRTRRRFAAAGGALAAAAAIAIAYGAVADLPGREVLPPGQQQEQKSEEKVAEILDYRYAVGVKPAASGTGVTVTTYSVSEGKRTEIESWTTDGKAISLAPEGANDGPLLGVAPAGATSLMEVADQGFLWSSTQTTMPIGDTGFQAIGFRFDPPSDGTKVKDIIWTDDEGGHTAAGEDLPSLSISNGGAWLVLDEAHRLLLNGGPDLGENTGWPYNYPEGSVPWRPENIANPDDPQQKLQVLSAMFVLPTEGHTAKSVKVTWSNGTTTVGGSVDQPSQGWTFAFSELKQGKNDGSGQIAPTSVEWTDETGRVHTEPVKAGPLPGRG